MEGIVDKLKEVAIDMGPGLIAAILILVIGRLAAKGIRALLKRAPMIGVVELADSSVNFVVRPWVKTADYWPVFFDTQEKIKTRFDSEGITIPFPQQDIHMDNHD